MSSSLSGFIKKKAARYILKVFFFFEFFTSDFFSACLGKNSLFFAKSIIVRGA